jgi:hypothetical protein
VSAKSFSGICVLYLPTAIGSCSSVINNASSLVGNERSDWLKISEKSVSDRFSFEIYYQMCHVVIACGLMIGIGN